MTCTLCNTALQNRADEVYFICSTCGAYVMDRQHYVSKARERAEYELHNNDVNDRRYQRFTSPVTETVLEHFDATHSGLDYGSGTGPVITEQLRERGLKVRCYDPFFCPDLGYLNEQYDYIFSCEVFEHFHYPRREIEKLLSLLKPKGKLIIMTLLYDGAIAFQRWHYRTDPTHVFIYTKQTVDYLSSAFGLDIEKQEKRLIVLAKA